MSHSHIRWLVLACFAALIVTLASYAQDAGTGEPSGASRRVNEGDIQSLTFQTAQIALHGLGDSLQFVVTAMMAGREQDLTGDVKYEVHDPAVLRITSSGRVFPLANGTTEVTARIAGQSATTVIECSQCDVILPVSFPNQVVPVFTKLGCNSGGCHGKAGGQNGFALSLLGFVPEMDYTALVKEDRPTSLSRRPRSQFASPESNRHTAPRRRPAHRTGVRRIQAGAPLDHGRNAVFSAQ